MGEWAGETVGPEVWETLPLPEISSAPVTPIVGFKGHGYELTIGDGAPGKQTMALREHVLDIQYGRAEDRHGWMRRAL